MELISREALIKDAKSWVAVDEYEKHLKEIVIEWIKEFPSAKLGTNLAEVGTDCISRQAAVDALRDYLLEKRCPDDGTLTCRLIENEVINKLPSIQPKRGKWIDLHTKEEIYGEMYKCSVCGDFDFGGCFCPNCGADMRSDDMREVTT